MRTLKISGGGVLPRAGIIALTVKELCSVPVDGPLALYGDVFSVGCRDQNDVAVSRWDSISGPVMIRIRASQKSALRGKVESDIAP
jgi:hypothetical protein